MKIDTVKQFAATTRLALSDEEVESLAKDLEVTLGYINQVDELSIEDSGPIVPTHRNVVREDVVTTETGEYTNLMLSQAIGQADGFVKVKKIL